MAAIEITILGTTAGVPTRERAHAAFYVRYEDKEESCLLFDCGENAQRQMLLAGINPMKIDNVFLTHWHGDHSLGLPGLVDTMSFEERSRPLTVCAPEASRIKKCLAICYSINRFKVISKNVPSKGSKITTLLDNKRFKIISVPVKHGVPSVCYSLVEKDRVKIDKEKALAAGLPEKAEVYHELKDKGSVSFEGKKIFLKDVSSVTKGRKVVYSGDTEICDNLRKMAYECDLLIQDCTYMDEDAQGGKYQHASLLEVAEMARTEGVKRVILTHIGRKYQDVEELRKLAGKFPNFEVAEDFMVVRV